MNMSKFERRRREMEKKFQEEMKALEEAERQEVKKRIDPIVSKIAKLAEEEARKALEAKPEILETYSFKKREATKEMRAMLDSMFAEEGRDEVEAPAKTEEMPTKPEENTSAPVDDNQQPADDDPFTSDFKPEGAGSDGGEPAEAESDEQKQPEKKGFGPFSR